MSDNSKFIDPYWTEWSDRIITNYGLKKTATGEFHGPCPVCGGVDRFWIKETDSKVKAFCRQGCDIKQLSAAMRADSCWPDAQRKDDWPPMQSATNPFTDTTAPQHDDSQLYHERKGVPLFGAQVQGDKVVVRILDINRNVVGVQTISPTGDKRFTKGMAKDGSFSVINGPLEGICYIAEGWATAASVSHSTGRPCVFALDAGNLPKVASLLIEARPKAEFIVAADNDEKGIAAAKQTNLPYVTPDAPGADWNDVMLHNGTDYVAQKLKPYDPLCEVVMANDAQPILRSSYLVKGWLGREQLAVVYGPSNVGKSFFMLDLAYHIAAGMDWNGHKVRGGPVLYLATEGGNAFHNRVYALNKKYGKKDVPLAVRASPVNLLDPNADLPKLERLIRAIEKQYGQLAMIVVDTLSRAMAGGNENGPEDMTAFINNTDHLREFAKASVSTVHHSGKDTAAGARGHSSLRAATDTEIELTYDDRFGIRFAKATKQRDMETGKEFAFSLDRVELGEDEDGDPVTTCTISEVSEDDVKEAKKPKPSGNNKLLMDAFWQLKGEGVGHENPAGAGWPDSGSYWVMDAEKLRDHFYGKLTTTDNAKRSAWKRSVEWLCNSGYAHVNDSKIGLLVKGGDDA